MIIRQNCCFASRKLLPDKQTIKAKRRSAIIGLARHGAERGEIAVDEPGIDRATPELVLAA